MITYSIIKKSELEGKKRLDAEYYHPKYKENEEIITNCGYPVELLKKLIYKLKNGFDYRVFSDSGFPYIRVGDLLHGEVLYREAEKVQISMCDIRKDIELKYRDILFSRKGTFGRAAVVEKEFTDFIISSEIMRLRLKNEKLNTYYLSTFLNSKFGFYQVERRTHGVSNFSITQEDLAGIKIPILPQKTQIKIWELVKQAYRESEQSYQFYLQAEQMLLDKMGFNNFDFSQPNNYTVPLNQTKEVSRIDAEHFQPKYDKLIQHLTKTGKTKLLGEIASYIKRGLQPTYVEDGEVFVFTEKHLGRSLLNIETAEATDTAFWEKNKKARVEKNNILLYSIGAYIGRANCYLEDKKAITSSNVTIIRIDKNRANPIYVSIFLNSIVGRMQAEKWTASVGQMALYPSDVPKFIIYLPSEEFQNKIAELVIQSYQARKKAKQLLQEAKEKVENLIENPLEISETQPEIIIPFTTPSKSVSPKPPVKIKYKEYQMLDASIKKLVQQVGDGSIIKRFEKTPIPKSKIDVICPHFLELKWATGCPYDCSWCYLKGTFRFLPYKAKPHIKDFDKIEKHTKTFLEYVQTPEVLNTGELADSLMFEGKNKSFVRFIVPLFENQSKHKVLFLTKSNKIKNLLLLNSHRQVIVSFSLNAIPVAQRWEKKAPSVEDRIKAAETLYKQGHEVRIRIDPMIPVENWKQLYTDLIDHIFNSFIPERITLGSLRGLQSTINGTSDKSWVKYLSERSNWGRKIDINLRLAMYKTIISYLNERYKYNKVALCKETLAIWDILNMDYKNIKCNCIW